MRAWLIELAAAAALAIAGVGLWTLPPDTPAIGRPPTFYGWLCVLVAGLIGILSTANYFGVEFQAPIRRKRIDQSKPTVAVGSTDPSKPNPLAEIVFEDTPLVDIVNLADTTGLTSAQVGALMAPHIGKWVVVEGVVANVNPSGSFSTQIVLAIEPDIRGLAYFKQDLDRAAALHVGTRIRVRGKISNVEKWRYLSLVECVFTDEPVRPASAAPARQQRPRRPSRRSKPNS